MEWKNPISEEIWRRIMVAVWAYAYEIENVSLVDDFTFDTIAQTIDLNLSTTYEGRDNSEIDKWFKDNFNPDTGMWIYDHPNLPRIREIYMRIKHHPKELEEEKDNIVSFTPKLLPGGKDGNPPNSTTWLTDLEEGTVFLCKDKTTNVFHLEEFQFIYKTEKSVRLFSSLNNKVNLWVIPYKFMSKYDLWEIRGICKYSEEEQQVINKEIKFLEE